MTGQRRARAGLTPVQRAPNTFCGPIAIAALTGLPIWVVEAAVKDHRTRCPPPKTGRPRKGEVVRVMWSSEVEAVLAALRWTVAEVRPMVARSNRPTFASWARNAENGLWLVLVTNHFVAVNRRTRMSQFVDTTHRDPILLRDAPCRRKRVSWAWRIEPYPGVIA